MVQRKEEQCWKIVPHQQGRGGGKGTREGQGEPVQEGREQHVQKYRTPRVTYA